MFKPIVFACVLTIILSTGCGIVQAGSPMLKVDMWGSPNSGCTPFFPFLVPTPPMLDVIAFSGSEQAPTGPLMEGGETGCYYWLWADWDRLETGAWAEGTYSRGLLHVTPDYVVHYTTWTGGSCRSMASFTDQWIIDRSGSTGGGVLRIKFMIDGPAAFVNLAHSVSEAGLELRAGSSPTVQAWTSASWSGPGTYSLSTPFTYGTPLDIQVMLHAMALVDCEHGLVTTPGVRVNATFAGVEVLDGAGATVSGYTLQSASGHFDVVPEPGALALCGLGAAVLLRTRPRSTRR